jgi:uroporphyrinogen-III synthase
MTPRIALFRAREDARVSAARLRRLGLSVACLPVIEIEARTVRPRQSRHDAVVATSDKAFLGDGPRDKSPPLYVVGARTGRAAQASGWRLASPPARDAPELIGRLISGLRPHASVLYLAGRDRKSVIEEALSKRFTLEIVEAYVAEARLSWRPAEARALASCVAALHYSRRSALLAAELAKIADEVERFLALRHFCLSDDIAGPLRTLGAAHITVAETPDEAGLFLALSRDLRRFPSLGASPI